MSNCIYPSGSFEEFGTLLENEHFSGLKEVSDTDGNKVVLEGAMWILYMGKMTTWREFRNFLWNHVQPYVKVNNLKCPTLIREESDGFEEEFRATIKFFPPGTERTADNWKKIF